MDKRPQLNIEIAVKDFQDFYWLKEELIAFCRAEGLKSSGAKIEISARIIHYLKTGEERASVQKIKSQSKFDWQNEELSLETIITDNYKNTENVREFFEKEIGQQFKFNVKFMNWMKSNIGKTLKESIEAWYLIKSEAKLRTKAKDIAPQFEYNRYLRDFLVDNPKANRETGIKLWKLKKSIRGNNRYNKEDLKLL